MSELHEKRNGYSLADCAEIMRAHGDLKLQHGEPGFQGPWEQLLASKGLTEQQWSQVWNDWWQAMEANPALAAKYHTYMGQLTVQGITAGQADVSQSALEGVTLEQFAKIGAKTQGGEDTAALLAAEGLSMDAWQRGQAAWGQKMSSISPSDPIMLQYGQLYQKYNAAIPQAGGGAVSMEQATAQVLDKHAQIQGNQSIEVTVQNASSEFFASPIVRHKARGVRAILNLWDRSSSTRASDAALRQVTQQAFGVCIDLLANGPGGGPGTGPGYESVQGSADPMEIHQWGDTHTEEEAYQGTVQTILSAFKDLAAAEFMTPEQSEQSKSAIRQAIQRLTPRRARVEQLFHGTQDVTKKTSLRSLLDDYTSVLDELKEALEDWPYQGPPSAADAFASPSFGASAPSVPSAMTVNVPATGILAILKNLPIIGQILRALGL